MFSVDFYNTSNFKLKERVKISSTFETILHYLFIKDEEIIKNKGSDAFQYLLFQRYLIYYLIFLTIICLTIILPINKQGNSGQTFNLLVKIH